jgi:hypothetical protein
MAQIEEILAQLRFSPTAILIAVILPFAGYHLAYIVYNLFVHPLRDFPGPRLSAATYIPEFYFDVLRSGRYTKQIVQMHKKYGRHGRDL